MVLVAAGYLKDALLEERYERVAHLPCAPLRHVLGYLFAQAKLGIDLRQPGEPAYSMVSLPPSKATSSARFVGVSERVVDVAQFLM